MSGDDLIDRVRSEQWTIGSTLCDEVEDVIDRMANRSAELAGHIGELCAQAKIVAIWHTINPDSEETANAIAELQRCAQRATETIHGSGK